MPPPPSSPVTRRAVLLGGAATLAAASVGSPAGAAAATPSRADVFTLGVASGDPAPDGVVLWTRLARDPHATRTRPGAA